MARLTGPLTGISFVAGVATGVRMARVPFPRPGSKPEDIREYFRGNATGARISVAGQLISAGSLAAFTAQAARAMKGRARAAALAGGGFATAALATAAACAGSLTFNAGADAARDVKVHRAMFLAGGPAHGAGFGVLLAALGLGTDALPRNVALAIAAPNLLSPLYLVTEPAAWLVPIGRFPGLIAIGVAGQRLAR
jgi:hypothetical protein